MIKLSLSSLVPDNNLPKYRKSQLQSVTPEYNQWSMSGKWAFSWITYWRITSKSISWPHLCITTYRAFTKSEENWILNQPKTFTQALILFKVNYFNFLLLGTTSHQPDKLQCTQNMACWIVFNLRKYDRITKAMSTLHWLCIQGRIQYNVVSIMFNCLKGKPPIPHWLFAKETKHQVTAIIHNWHLSISILQEHSSLQFITCICQTKDLELSSCWSPQTGWHRDVQETTQNTPL